MIFRYYEILLRTPTQLGCAKASETIQSLGYELESADQEFSKLNTWKLRGGSFVDSNLTNEKMFEQVDEAFKEVCDVQILETKLFFT